MKLTINQLLLKKEILTANRIVEKKSPIPVLQSCLLSWADNRLEITSTNLDLFFTTVIECETVGAGAACVVARDLARIVAVCGEEITLEFDERSVRLITFGGKSCWTLPTQARDRYPEKPVIGATDVVMPFKELRAAINHTLYCVTKEQSRFTLTGVLAMFGNDVSFAATDGHRLAFYELAYKATKKRFDVLIPAEALKFLEAIKDVDTVGIGRTVVTVEQQNAVARLKAQPDLPKPVTEDQTSWIHFTLGHRRFSARNLTGRFPNIEAVIPSGAQLSAHFDVIALHTALRQATTILDGRPQITWTFKSDGVSEFVSRGEESRFQTEIVTNYTGAPQTFGFNPNYLTDLCKRISGACRVDFTHGNAPVVFEPKVGDNARLRYIVMPLRV